MKSINLFCCVALLSVGTLALAEEKSASKIDFEGNLALVPAADPDASNAPTLVPAIKGKHPRLLFTQDEIDALKKAIPGDPILKRAYDDLTAYAKAAKPVPKEQIHGIMLADTPSLSTVMERYAMFAVAYALDRDPKIKQIIIGILTDMINEPYWGGAAELDSNMGAANNMLGAAVLYDSIYNDLEPEFRAKVANALLVHARRMYYLGHCMRALNAVKYWQNDPQPNHRWYRDAGLIGSVLAIVDESGIKADFLLQEAKKELDFVIKWYPEDGDCHEGAGYQRFGFMSLLNASEMMDRCLGTSYLKSPGFRNVWAQQLYYTVPAYTRNMSFGDDQNAPSAYRFLDGTFFVGAKLSRDQDIHAAMKRHFLKQAIDPAPGRTYLYPWTLLMYYDPSVGEGDYKALTPYRIFPDLGAVSMRDSWEENAFAMTFKCGPSGGYKLNEYRETVREKDGQPHYINVAHDDPDANSFSMTSAGDFLFHPGLYSLNKSTQSHSTITVDGIGQVSEGDSYSQPVDGVDMRTLSYLTGWKVGEKGRLIVEGEAGGAYRGINGPDLRKRYSEDHSAGKTASIPSSVLKRYRRTVIWMPQEYVLMLDDIQGVGPHDIMWRGTVKKGQFDKPEEGRCHAYTSSGAQLDFQILANKEFNGAIDFVFLDGRWGSELNHQFQFSLHTEAVKFACLFDPWKKKPSMKLSENGNAVTLTVLRAGTEDTWTWTSAPDATTPSSIVGTRGISDLIVLKNSDTAPRE